ncbi:hydrogenase formation protein HypD [candidate division KSB1 bacterium]|nr:MAG: hydrogenase formation protein HypD [candidate division KSB1 bacterium]
MKYLSEFRDIKAIQKYIERIKIILNGQKISLMEVCGTHTMAISRYGIRSIVPENLRLISGPGCPVCVTPNYYIDRAVALAKEEDIIVATFGDMLRVPGSLSSLELVKIKGGDVRIVYSTMDALKIAENNPSKNVVFLGIGFETTAPTIAASIKEAKNKNIKNYFVLCAHKVMPPAMKALVANEKIGIDGFICPGHVSTIIGSNPYKFIPESYNKACVIAGFEPVDIVISIEMLIKQVIKGKPEVEIQYKRVVKPDGNTFALKTMYEVFEPCDSEWRGIGVIEGSGLKIKKDYSDFDAEENFEVEVETVRENKECICGLVLQGLKYPYECKLFRKLCTPENPVGACMVSSEGTCAAYFKYSDM